MKLHELRKQESIQNDGDSEMLPPELYKLTEFMCAAFYGFLNDDDGYGIFVAGERRGEAVLPSEFLKSVKMTPEWATHIEWCGK